MKKNLNEIVNNLQPSCSALISECNGIQCFVERSGDGKTVRYVRVSNNGNNIEVFKTTKF